jgi:Tfp pilus assembly protein PilN
MKPIYINFAPQSVKRSVIMTPPLNWLFAAIGLLLCSSAAVFALGLIQQHAINADAQRIQARQAEGKKHRSAQNSWSISDTQIISVNNAISQLNVPWRDLLDAIETATPANVALLSIEPDSKKHTIKGMAEAKTSQEMIAYIERLKKQEFFGAVVLTKHEINDQDANKPYRFQFEAQWTTDGRGGQ